MLAIIILSYTAFFAVNFKLILKFEWNQNKFQNYIIPCISACITIFLAIYLNEQIIAVLLALFNSAIFCIFAFNRTIKQKIYYLAHAYLGCSIIEEPIGSIYQYIFDLKEPYNNFLTVLTIIILIDLFCAFFRKYLYTESFRVPDKLAIIILTFEFVFMLMQSMSAAVLDFLNQDNFFGHSNVVESIISILIGAGAILIVLMIYLMIFNFNQRIENQLQISTLEKFNTQQKAYYQLLLSKETETRKYRHDLTNNLLQLQFYHQKNDSLLLEEKLQSMINDVNLIRNKSFTLGIEILDVVVNYYLSHKQDQIEILVSSKYVDNPRLRVSDTDLCIIIANLITNAIEATLRLPKEKRYIKINSILGQSNMKFSIENSYDESYDQQIIDGTSKADSQNHGFGLTNIISLTQKNNCVYNCRHDHGTYYAEVLFTI